MRHLNMFGCVLGQPGGIRASICLTSEILVAGFESGLFASAIDRGELLLAVGTSELFFIPQTAACVRF